MMEVYKAISKVQSELAKLGISKDAKSQQGNYKYRGIDQVYAALSPLLAKHELTIIPRVIERDTVERTTKGGGAIFYTWVKAEFDLVSAVDGSKHVASIFGEAMDTSDKSTNKAMSAAYKYMAFLTFAIPVEGDEDADARTHEVDVEPPESVKMMLQGLERAIMSGDPGKYWADNFPAIEKRWRTYVRAQADEMKKHMPPAPAAEQREPSPMEAG